MRRASDRQKLADMIRDELPWAHVVAGSSGHAFLIVSRGESIRGYRGNVTSQQAWSRPLPGSVYLLWELGASKLRLVRHDPPEASETGGGDWRATRRRIAERTIREFKAPRESGAEWMESAARQLVRLAKTNCVPVDPQVAETWLVEGERVEVKADREVAS